MDTAYGKWTFLPFLLHVPVALQRSLDVVDTEPTTLVPEQPGHGRKIRSLTARHYLGNVPKHPHCKTC